MTAKLKRWEHHDFGRKSVKTDSFTVLVALRTYEENKASIERARSIYLRSSGKYVQTAFSDPYCREEEAAALAYLLKSADKWGFVPRAAPDHVTSIAV
jgi:hypothetical protein